MMITLLAWSLTCTVLNLDTHAMEQFLSGAIAMGSWVAGVFFWRFWHQTADRLFAIFALAFWVMALQRVALALLNTSEESPVMIYVVRLIAFVLILVAIVDKNARQS